MNERTEFIRTWWDEYLRVLRNPHWGTACTSKLNELTRQGEASGVIRAGLPMPRDGALDLAARCDELIRVRTIRSKKFFPKEIPDV